MSTPSPVCDALKEFVKHNIFVHYGYGKNKKEDYKYIMYRGGELKSTIATNDVFAPIKKNKIYSNWVSKPGIAGEQNQIIWCSQGSWLVDENLDGQMTCEDRKFTQFQTLAISNPNNILYVDDAKSLESFIDKYVEYDKKHDVCENRPFIPNKINFKRLSKDFYGVFFNFRKVTDIYPKININNPRYQWHYGYDVETLLIWDTRAINGVTPIKWGGKKKYKPPIWVSRNYPKSSVNYVYKLNKKNNMLEVVAVPAPITPQQKTGAERSISGKRSKSKERSKSKKQRTSLKKRKSIKRKTQSKK